MVRQVWSWEKRYLLENNEHLVKNVDEIKSREGEECGTEDLFLRNFSI